MDRQLIYHWIYLAEACVVARWMRAATLRHVHAHFGITLPRGDAPASLPARPTAACRPRRVRPAGRDWLAEKIRRAGFVVGVAFTRSQLFRWVDSAHWDKIRSSIAVSTGRFRPGRRRRQ
jgi:hypothetical protein